MKLYLLEHHIDKLFKSLQQKKTLEKEDIKFKELSSFGTLSGKEDDSKLVNIRPQEYFLPKHRKINKEYSSYLEKVKLNQSYLIRRVDKMLNGNHEVRILNMFSKRYEINKKEYPEWIYV